MKEAYPRLVATCIRLVEPIAFSQIFPYINEYLGDLHVTNDPKQIGFYSGLVVRSISFFVYGVTDSPVGKYIRCISARVYILSVQAFRSAEVPLPTILSSSKIYTLDRIGRRPVILWGNAGVAIATFLFGLSKNLPTMLAFRAMAGLCSGNAPVMHSVIAEITDSTNFGLALPIYSTAFYTGNVVGYVPESRTLLLLLTLLS